MKHDTLTPMESADLGSPSAEHKPRFVTDDEIRACSYGGHQQYEIASRPKKGPTMWHDRRTGKEMTQAEVLKEERLLQAPPKG